MFPVRYYISIEKNIEVFNSYKLLWNERGVEGIRVNTMTETIKEAIKIEKSQTDDLFFIDIVADDINYMPQLKILSEETNAPILIATSNYNEEENYEALNNGADFYGGYCDKPEKNINAVVAFINSLERREKKQNVQNKIFAHGDILIVLNQHKVFIKDTEVLLTNTETKTLYYMMVNKGNVLSHNQIYRKVYDEYDELSSDVIYSIIKRLRKKMREINPFDYIETVRDIGYRLITKSNV